MSANDDREAAASDPGPSLLEYARACATGRGSLAVNHRDHSTAGHWALIR